MALKIGIESEGPGREVELTRRAGGQPSLLRIDGCTYGASLSALGEAAEVSVDGLTERVWIAVEHDAVFVHAFGRSFRLDVIDPAERGLAGADEADVYSAPMPGTVIRTTVGPGQDVSAGEVLMVIESMKMQAEIVAWRDGVVQRLALAVGDTFNRGAILVEFEPAAAEGNGAP